MNWYKKASRSFSEHVRDVIKADLDSPIFITESYEIIDGAHRTAKASILNKTVKSIMLTQEEINKAYLPKEDNYVGQIYRDNDKNEYSVTKLIELYGKRKPIIMNPKVILDHSPDVWGKKMDIYEIIEEAKNELV